MMYTKFFLQDQLLEEEIQELDRKVTTKLGSLSNMFSILY